MHRKLTITLDDDVYQALHQRVGRGSISALIEGLVRTHVLGEDDLAALYREAAADAEREREALEWIEANPDEALE